MINLVYTPQRAEIKASYEISSDILTVTIDESMEVFDFTELEEGIAEEIVIEELPINPIVSAKKNGDTVDIKVIKFYGEDEKEVFENGDNKVEN